MAQLTRIGVIVVAFAAMTRLQGAESLVCGEKAARPAHVDPVDQIVLRQMAIEKIPGLSLAVLHGKEVVKRQAYGVASVELCAPATTDTRFGIGSISKQFTAAAIMLLAQEGKLALDDPINKFFPEVGGAWKGVTIRQLLTHTAGVRDYLVNDPAHLPTLAFDRKQNVTAVDFLRRLSREPQTFVPGSGFGYSNAGYVLLGMIVERVSGMKFREFMRERVFAPLGLDNTGFLTPAEIIPNRAIGYETDDGKLSTGDYVSDFYATQGDTSMYMTADDMAKWIGAVIGDQFIRPEMHRQMWSPFQFADGTTTNYGFGWIFSDVRGVPITLHSGSFIAGYSAYIVHFPRSRYTVFFEIGRASCRERV